ncbi:MAG: hypothetical protein IJR05_04670 [Acidaminococcaceae bacterium]|nr:hypothetical protein [Acidaminococcaceae bacterium]
MVAICDYLKLKLRQKGQGIVEYALLLAFIVGIAMMLNGVGLKDAVVGVFDDVAEVLAGGEEFDLNTPDGRLAADKANMKKLGNAFANSFKASTSPNNTATWNVIDDGKLVIQKNFAVAYVFPDGTADLFVDGDKNPTSFWLSDIKETDPDKYNLYNQTLQNAGIDLFNQNAMKINSASDGGDLRQGYAVVFSKNGDISYWGYGKGTINKDVYKQSGYQYQTTLAMNAESGNDNWTQFNNKLDGID